MTALGSEALVNTTVTGRQEYSSIVALAGGGRVVVWEAADGDGRGIFAQRYDAAGVKAGLEFEVNTLTTGEQAGASITALSDGGFVAVWRSNNIGGSFLQPPFFRGQRYDANGVAQGGEFGLTTPAGWDGNVGYPSVTARASGGFAVVWDYYVHIEQGGLDVGLTGHVFGQLYDATGAADGSAFEVSDVTQADLDQRQSSVTGLADGGFVVAWSARDGFATTSHDEVYVRRYDSAGAPLAGQARVNAVLSDYYSATSTSAAALSWGGYVVAWTTYSRTTPPGQPSERAVYASLVDAGGTVHAEFRVNTSALASLGSVYGLAGGGFVVTYTVGSSEVFAQVYDALGAAVGNEFHINETLTGTQTVVDYSTVSSVAQLADGTLVFTWSGEGAGDSYGVFTRSFSLPPDAADGANDTPDAADDEIEVGGDETFVNVLVDLNDGDADGDARTVTSVSTAVHGVTAINPDGTIRYTPNAGFLGEDSFSYTIGDGHGGSDTASVTVTIPNHEIQANTYETVAQFNASLAAFDAGGYVIVWTSNGQDGSGGGVYGQRYDANNAPAGVEFHASVTTASSQSDAAVATLSNGNFVVTWTSTDSGPDDNVYYRLYDASGATILTQTGANTTTANSQNETRVVGLADGDFIVTFRTFGTPNSTLSYQRFNADGMRDGVETNVTSAANIGLPSVTGLANGGFVVTWQTSGSDLFGQRFDAAGVAVGSAFAIGDPSDSSYSPSIVALDGGGFVALWSVTHSGTESDVFGRVYDAAGTPAPDAFLVNETEAGRQDATGSVIGATLADGSLVVAWSGEGNGDDNGVYHRRFLFTSNSPTAGDDVLTGTDDADYFDLSQGGNDTVDGGGGNDAFYFGAAFTAADTVNGGAGSNDQVGLEGNYTGANALVLGAGTISGVEVIALLPGFDYDLTTVDANVPNGGTLKIFAGGLGVGDDFTFDGSAETDGNFMVFGGLGTDVIKTGAGVDGIYFGPGKFDPTVDRVDGGSGINDQLALDGDYTLTLDGVAIKNIDVIALLKGIPGDLADYNLTLANSLTLAGQTTTIWGSQVDTVLTVNGAAESDGALRIFGGTLGDTLTGGAGDDWFWGGLGGDTMTGGLGADTFMFSGAAESSGTNVDRLFGFDDAADHIDLPFAVTGFATAASGTLNTATRSATLESACSTLTAHQAVMFTANGGDLNGHVFLVVDSDGVTGYQNASDYLIEMAAPATPLDQAGLFV